LTTIKGIDVTECVMTSEKVGVEIHISESGASWGSIENSVTLLEGAEKLIQNGCTAIAVVVRFPEDEDIDGENDGNGGISVDEAAARFAAYRQGEVRTVYVTDIRNLRTLHTVSTESCVVHQLSVHNFF
jgi:hypothetical protein